MTLSPAARGFVAFAVVVMVTSAAVITGLVVIVQTKGEAVEGREQSEVNHNILREVERISEDNAALLRVVLAVTGCTVTDTPEQCRARIVGGANAEGAGRIAEIDCRFRRALASLPPPSEGELCTL